MEAKEAARLTSVTKPEYVLVYTRIKQQEEHT